MRMLIAGTNDSELEQALRRLVQDSNVTADEAVTIVEARDEVRAEERI